MVYRVEREDQTVWSNTTARLFHSLTEFFRCTIPIKTPFNLSALYIYFEKTEVSPEDTLEICVFCSDKDYLYYTVKLEDVPAGAPIKLENDKKPLFKDFINISIKYNSVGDQGAVSIGINEKGPCIAITGKTIEEVSLDYEPLISIVTPVYNENLEYFKKTYESVINQIYPNWEWIIVEDCSKNKKIRTFLKSIGDRRIKVLFNDKNLGIVGASNVALEKVSGEYVTFLDDDDLLTPDALLCVAAAIDQDRDLKLIYTDEDKVTFDGVYVDPFFKSDWSYNMILSQNYTCHLSTYLLSVLKSIGGVHKGYEGSQDHDLVLRFIERIDEKDIKHIPRILYHWRKYEGSTSSCITNKPYAHIGGLCAVRDHLKRIKEKARVTSDRYYGSYNVDYRLKGKPFIHIIIPTRDNPIYLKTCCFSIEQSTYDNFTVTIVDNGSIHKETRQLFCELQKNKKFQVISYNKPFNFSKINNYAVKKGPEADLLLFLNDDTEVISADWMERLAQHIGRNNVAISGAKLLYGNNEIQHAGVIIGCGGIAGHSHKKVPDAHPGYFMRPHIVQDVSAVTGACLMIDRKVFYEIGEFEDRLPKAFNDIDLCLKVRKKGYHIVYNPHACLFHHESVSRGIDNAQEADFAKAIEYMNKKWHCSSFKDPYYNPNLTLSSEIFSFRVES